MLKLRVVIALIVREVDVKGARWDRLHLVKENGIPTMDGKKVYQIEKEFTHPTDKVPLQGDY